MGIQLSLLNHACIKLEIEDVSFLFDPWLIGTCFKNGWGLRYKNDNAVNEAVNATHMWISHFHNDHLHFPTLKEIVSKNSDITVIANKSLNFDMTEPLKQSGFKNIIPLHERKEIQLSKNVSVIRYPTAGIDNMLLIKSPSCTILNFNDVNLPSKSLELLIKKLPKIDILFSNFNHAQRLLEYPLNDPEITKDALTERFLGKLKIINPKWVIPYASFHWYMNQDSREQNITLLTNTELKNRAEKLDDSSEKIIPVNVGQKVEFDDKMQLPKISGQSGIEQIEDLDYARPAQSSKDEVLESANEFIKKIKKNNTFYQFSMNPLRILVSDLKEVLVIDKKKCSFSTNSDHFDISAYSGELYNWITTNFGTDTFCVGAHFKTESKNLSPLKKLFFYALLDENQLSPKDFMNYLKSSSGRRFLWCRREEIFGTLFSGAFQVGSRS